MLQVRRRLRRGRLVGVHRRAHAARRSVRRTALLRRWRSLRVLQMLRVRRWAAHVRRRSRRRGRSLKMVLLRGRTVHWTLAGHWRSTLLHLLLELLLLQNV